MMPANVCRRTMRRERVNCWPYPKQGNCTCGSLAKPVLRSDSDVGLEMTAGNLLSVPDSGACDPSPPRSRLEEFGGGDARPCGIDCYGAHVLEAGHIVDTEHRC